jgi:hypothetical protein
MVPSNIAGASARQQVESACRNFNKVDRAAAVAVNDLNRLDLILLALERAQPSQLELHLHAACSTVAAEVETGRGERSVPSRRP